jgi:hypothetical protein
VTTFRQGNGGNQPVYASPSTALKKLKALLRVQIGGVDEDVGIHQHPRPIRYLGKAHCS